MLQNPVNPLLHKKDEDKSVSIDNAKYMSYFWIFVVAQAIFGLLKYGPFSVDNCKMIESDFTDSCSSYPLYIVQCGSYFLLLVLITFCSCQQEQSIIFELYPKQCCSCDHLLFPFTLLISMGIFQLVIAVSQAYYFWQLGVDIFGYTIWFLYAPIFTAVLKSCPAHVRNHDKKNHQLFMCHIIIVFVASFGIIWLLITMFSEDFQFEVYDDNPVVFIQIILECTLILEWIHVVLHGCVREKSHGDQSIGLTVNVVHQDQGAGNQNDEGDEKEKERITKAANEDRGNLLSDGCFYFIFVLDLGAVFVFDIWKTVFNHKCSSFDMHIDKHCPFYLWVLEATALTIGVIMLLVLLCRKDKYILLLEYYRLFFPVILWVILMLIEWIYVFVVNKWFVIQIWVDFAGYIIFFHQALYAVQLRKYIVSISQINKEGVHTTLTRLLFKKHDNQHFPSCEIRDTRCNPRLAIISLICFVDFLLCLAVLIVNFYRDINVVESAAESIDFDTNVVMILAFMQIIFENALLFEYIHVLLGACN